LLFFSISTGSKDNTIQSFREKAIFSEGFENSVACYNENIFEFFNER